MKDVWSNREYDGWLRLVARDVEWHMERVLREPYGQDVDRCVKGTNKVGEWRVEGMLRKRLQKEFMKWWLRLSKEPRELRGYEDAEYVRRDAKRTGEWERSCGV